MKHSNINLLLHSIDKFTELTIFSHLTNLTKPIYLVKLANDSQGNPIVAFVQAQQTVFHKIQKKHTPRDFEIGEILN